MDRWTAKRKERLVLDMRQVSYAELLEWSQNYDAYGLQGLKNTKQPKKHAVQTIRERFDDILEEAKEVNGDNWQFKIKNIIALCTK